MAVKIVEIKKESCPATRFIGKKYIGGANWGEWWANNWFSILEANKPIAFNQNAYIGASKDIIVPDLLRLMNWAM